MLLCYDVLSVNLYSRGPYGVHLLEIGSVAWGRDLPKTAQLTLDCKSDIFKLFTITLICIHLWAHGP